MTTTRYVRLLNLSPTPISRLTPISLLQSYGEVEIIQSISEAGPPTSDYGSAGDVLGEGGEDNDEVCLSLERTPPRSNLSADLPFLSFSQIEM